MLKKKYYPSQNELHCPFLSICGKVLWGYVCKGVLGTGQPSVLNCNTLCFTVSTDILLPAKMAFLLAMPSVLLWTKPCPGGRLLPVLLPLCPLPLLHQRGISFALQGEPLTFREHIVVEFPDMCCPGLSAILPQCSSFFPHLLPSKTSALSSLSRLSILWFL